MLSRPRQAPLRPGVTSTRRRRPALVPSLVLGALLGLGSLAPAAAADDAQDPADEPAPDLVSFGISPAGPERPDDRPYVSLVAPAGAVVYEHVALLNQDEDPVSLDVYATDVVMADGAGLTARVRTDVSTDAGSWISISGPTDVEVAAQTAESGYGWAVVPFSVTIPADAEPGDHLAGIVASLVSVGGADAGVPAVELEQRVVARVYVRVDGELAPGLEVTDVTASWEPGSLLGTGAVVVTSTLRNTGNTRMAIEPAVTVSGPLGLLPRTQPGERVDELMPGASVETISTVAGVWPLLRGSVTVDATVLAPTAGEDPGLGTVSATTTVWMPPWALLALVVLLVALVVLVGLRRRGRRARSHPRPVRGRRGDRPTGRRRATGARTVPAPAGPAPTSPAAPPPGPGAVEPAAERDRVVGAGGGPAR